MRARTTWMVLALLGACGKGDADSDLQDATPEPDETETAEAGTTDTWSPAYATETPTDVTADCWSWARSDWSDDGIVDGTTLETYDAATLATLHYEWDDYADGYPDYVADFAYDDGLLTVSSYDDDADGQYDLVYERTYDANGNLVTYAIDEGADGSWEEVWTYLYDGEDRVAIEVDLDDDGTIDTRYTYARDADGRVVTIDGDHGDDGTPDLRYTYLYAYATGYDSTVELDDGIDGVVDETWIYAYDDQDRITDYEYWNLDGDQYIYEYTYTADSDVATITGTVYDQGQWWYDFVTTYTWLAPKMLDTSVFEADLYGEGTFGYVSIDTYTWTCP